MEPRKLSQRLGRLGGATGASGRGLMRAGAIYLALTALCATAWADEPAVSTTSTIGVEPTSSGAEESPSNSPDEDMHRAWHFTVTMKTTVGVAYEPESTSASVYGVGAQIDFPLVEHELEIEVGGTYHREHAIGVAGAEVLLAHVFDANNVVQPYIAMGPAFLWEEDNFHGALHASMGTNLWARGHWGAHLEANYVRVFAPNLDEITGGLGVSYRY